MIAVIRYHTPYIVNGKYTLILLFAVDDDTLLRSVLGLPTLLAMNTMIALQRGILACSEHQHTFVIQLDPLGKGLPYDVSLDASNPTILLRVYSNISSATSSNHLLLWTVSIPLFAKQLFRMVFLLIIGFSKAVSLDP